MAESKLRDFSMDFSVEVLEICDSIKGHSSITNQLERSKGKYVAFFRKETLLWIKIIRKSKI